VTAEVLSASAVLISAVASHAFHSWLRQRERERLSATDRAVLEKRFDDFEAFRRDVKSFMANNGPRR